mmetsp:Transcript_7171/g.7340  ORF Transcript_7171/g.7340 Transcript_7171/m.7340 type:complete len:125 (+) Transcript_7171:217-591(+)
MPLATLPNGVRFSPPVWPASTGMIRSAWIGICTIATTTAGHLEWLLFGFRFLMPLGVTNKILSPLTTRTMTSQRSIVTPTGDFGAVAGEYRVCQEVDPGGDAGGAQRCQCAYQFAAVQLWKFGA